jgi:hypothetical protein
MEWKDECQRLTCPVFSSMSNLRLVWMAAGQIFLVTKISNKFYILFVSCYASTAATTQPRVRPSRGSGRIAALNTSAWAFASLRPNQALELMRPLRGRQFSAAISYPGRLGAKRKY